MALQKENAGSDQAAGVSKSQLSSAKNLILLDRYSIYLSTPHIICGLNMAIVGSSYFSCQFNFSVGGAIFTQSDEDDFETEAVPDSVRNPSRLPGPSLNHVLLEGNFHIFRSAKEDIDHKFAVWIGCPFSHVTAALG